MRAGENVYAKRGLFGEKAIRLLWTKRSLIYPKTFHNYLDLKNVY